MVGAPWDGSLNNQPYIPLIYSGYLLGIRLPAFSLWSTIVQQLKARQTWKNNSMFWKKEPWAMWRMPWWHPQTNAYQPDPNKNWRLFYILQSVPVGQYQDPRNPLQSHNTTGRQWTMGKHKWLCDHGRDFCSTGCFCSLMKWSMTHRCFACRHENIWSRRFGGEAEIFEPKCPLMCPQPHWKVKRHVSICQTNNLQSGKNTYTVNSEQKHISSSSEYLFL